jgi:hypothetical protein
MALPFLVLTLFSAAVGVISAVAASAYVARRGKKIDYFLWRIMIFRYFTEYRLLSVNETGRIGPWYYTFIASMALAFVFAVAGIVLK